MLLLPPVLPTSVLGLSPAQCAPLEVLVICVLRYAAKVGNLRLALLLLLPLLLEVVTALV